ncbi:MAG TPA: YdeI/OmpD-associated family protein [Actinomycetota bacterium]|nr:YdeI/OmpD-associated family protein [Actinomycetota bacterium]
MDPIFFATPADFRAWLEENHQTADEVVVGYYKKKAGKPSMSWSESVDQAPCFGWIDGKGKSLGDEAHTIRFTPRRPRSNWSEVNIKKVEELTKAGLMRPAGLAAFEKREEARSGVYSYEQRHLATLTEEQEAEFKANPAAWEWFNAAAPSYRKAAIFWVASAKREETRTRRLQQLIDDSAAGLEVPPLRRR